jgi:hypothetical protein
MHPADQFEAFAKLHNEEGRTVLRKRTWPALAISMIAVDAPASPSIRDRVQ